MRYEDYKVEDMVFTTKEDWTEQEMKEFLDTCPECKDNEDTIKALINIDQAIQNGTLKTNRYGDINKISAKSYAKNHLYVYYGKCGKYYGDDCLYVILDGKNEAVGSSRWNINRLLCNMKDIRRRFEYISDRYKKKEKEYVTKKETAEYTEKYTDRIMLSKKAAAWLDNFRLDVPIGIEKKEWMDDNKLPEYYAKKKYFSGTNYYHTNDHGELTFFDYPITEDEAKKIIEVISEASRKVSLIMDRCKVELDEIFEKYRDMCKERSNKDEK